MTTDEMKTFAQAILDGGPAKKSEVVAFMRAYMDPDIQAGGPAMTTEEVAAYLPVLGFQIEKTDTGIHLPREANRAYSKAETASLLKMIAEALK